jgi:(1->4)-alpha-D-glucan 1-alpha-D-glucosylmutase
MWPTDPPHDEQYPELVSRLQAYMEKATHEAKVRTSWINPNTAYDEAVRRFVAAVVDPANRKFLTDFQRFLDQVLDWGMYTALSQVTLKLLSPGVPDIYQGQEVWDYSLVDPDNRRPVDYQQRREWLDEIDQAIQSGPEGQRALAQTLGRIPRNPRLKLLTTSTLLKLRRDQAELFAKGEYLPLEVQGNAARHVCAFAWRLDRGEESRAMIVIVPRFLAQLAASPDRSSTQHVLDAATWGNTEVVLDGWSDGAWRNAFTGVSHQLSGKSLFVRDVLVDFPVAVLTRR